MHSVNHQLATGWFSSLVQRPGVDRQDSPRGLAAQGISAAAQLQDRGVAPDIQVIQHQLPGNVPRHVAQVPIGTASTIECVETGKELPRVPREWEPAIKDYYLGCKIAFDPGDGSLERPASFKDAFHESINGQPLLPETVRSSTLLNRGAIGPAGAGKVFKGISNTLHDPATGLSASISLRNGNEVVIAFGGCGSQGATVSQAVRCAINLLGLSPPASFPQAARLTALVQAHLDKVNETLPVDKQLKLTLAGHSMGGGIATYAALRCGVPAMVMAPMRLGYMSRQSLGPTAIARAPNLVTEVSCARDWVAANPLSRFMHWMGMKNSVGALGSRYLIKVPTPQELTQRGHVAQGFSSHVHLDIALEVQVAQETEEAAKQAKLQPKRTHVASTPHSSQLHAPQQADLDRKHS